MEGGGFGQLVAIITGRPEKVQSGGLPVFIQQEEEGRRRLALTVAKIVRGVVHQLEDETYVVARH